MGISDEKVRKQKARLAASKKKARSQTKEALAKFLKAKDKLNETLAVSSIGIGSVPMKHCNEQPQACKCGQGNGNDEEPDHDAIVEILNGKATGQNLDVVIHKGKRRRIIWEIKTPGWRFDDKKPIYIAPVPGTNKEPDFVKRFGWKFENDDRTRLIVCGHATGGKWVSCAYNLRMWEGNSTNYAVLDPTLDCEF